MQSSFSALEFAAKKKLTRRERFLREIDAVTPWAELIARIEPFYPKGTGRGRPPIGLPRMLRMYVAQQCLGLSDAGIEDAVFDSQAIRGVIGIDLARESAPTAVRATRRCTGQRRAASGTLNRKDLPSDDSTLCVPRLGTFFTSEAEQPWNRSSDSGSTLRSA